MNKGKVRDTAFVQIKKKLIADILLLTERSSNSNYAKSLRKKSTIDLERIKNKFK